MKEDSSQEEQKSIMAAFEALVLTNVLALALGDVVNTQKLSKIQHSSYLMHVKPINVEAKWWNV